MMNDTYLKRAKQLDKEDVLAPLASRFHPPAENIIYLDGNSLGRPVSTSLEALRWSVETVWGERLIRGWNEEWLALPQQLSVKLARLLGCRDDEIVLSDSTSINLYKLAFAALRSRPERKRIVTDSLNFPTDFYIMQGLIQYHFTDHSLTVVSSQDDISLSEEEISAALDERTALLTLSHVSFKSAHLYDMKRINALAERKGVPVLWDLSHSAGSVVIDLEGSGADLAVGCTYKYLNGGPGAPAYLYVRRELQQELGNPIWGWFGHEDPFTFSSDYIPAPHAGSYAAGTPHILSLIPLEAGLDLLLEAGMENIRHKSMLQTSFLQELHDVFLGPLGFSLGSPAEAERRGSHISIRHPEAYRISQALIKPRDGAPVIIPDFRPPDSIRLGLAPLYISFTDIYRAIMRLKTIVEEKIFQNYDKRGAGVP